MRATADRYRRLSDDLAATIGSVPADRWSSPSPCEGWSALDLVRHVVQSEAMFFGLVGRAAPEVPSVDDDPAAAFDATRRAVLADLEDPELATAGFDGFDGPTTFEAAVDRFVCFDLLVHRWDLARAAGLEVELPADEVERVRGQAEAFGDVLRQGGACGPALDAPEGASPQDRLAAFLGRIV